ncbi:7-carboxy-7-deazaguanine synthase [hydrothermal vent metagenome]|uniref:7-carboxy-7-deazaguanine synthase n=1 Tax=hydrothermal vent metagenome TaxID=652676 RepID=A0A3B0WXQ4_9ZZZZ
MPADVLKTQDTESRLRITEIFYSLQGESSFVGLPTVFIRLTGCPLRCGYCDTAYAFSGGEWMPVADILQNIKQYNASTICVTGGEPLAQRSCGDLLTQLCDAGYRVSIETSGSLDISAVDSRVSRIMDIKTPGSGEESKNKYENIAHLTQHDEVKFVLCNRADYDWSKDIINQYQLLQKTQVLFSPVHEGVAPNDLADWIIEDRLNVRFQFQLHKFLWNNEPGR